MMNKTVYKIVGYLPILGPYIQAKTNFFAFKCSPFMDEFTKTDEYKLIFDWLKRHPNHVISPKKAKELLDKR